MVESTEMIVLRLLGGIESLDRDHCQLVKQVDELKWDVAELQKEIALLKTAQQATSFAVDSSPPEEGKIQVGDRIRVDYSEGSVFREGDTGVVVRIDKDGALWVNFAESQVGRIADDGVWCVSARRATKLRKDKS